MTNKKTLAMILILVAITGTLLYIDYYGDQGENAPSFVTSVLRNVFRSATITPEVLNETSLGGMPITALSSTNDFFAPYLSLSKNTTADRYTIETSTTPGEQNILVYEVQTPNPFQELNHLLSQESSLYQFNQIEGRAFYLNQVPAELKTHNFLAIVIDNILYGFQYFPIDHPKILELIDVLEKTE